MSLQAEHFMSLGGVLPQLEHTGLAAVFVMARDRGGNRAQLDGEGREEG